MGKDVIVACDFGSREETLAFLDRFTGKKPLCENRHGAVLCRGSPDCPGDQGPGPQNFSGFEAHDIPNTVKKGHGSPGAAWMWTW